MRRHHSKKLSGALRPPIGAARQSQQISSPQPNIVIDVNCGASENNNNNNNLIEEDSSLRAAISLFSSTYNGLTIKESKRTPATDAVNKTVRFSSSRPKNAAADEKLSAVSSALENSQQVESTALGKIVDKLARNHKSVTLDQVHAVTSCLASPILAINEESDVRVVEEFLMLAFVVAVNSHQALSTSRNVAESTGQTRLEAALLDTVTRLLDHVSGKIEQNQSEQLSSQQQQQPAASDAKSTSVSLAFYARVVSTFGRSPQASVASSFSPEEESKDEAKDDEVYRRVETEIQEYVRAPDAYLNELPVDTTRFTSAAKSSAYEKVEIYLTDSLKAAEAAATSQHQQQQLENDKDVAMLEDMKRPEQSSNAVVGNLDDLDSVLNFADKEFNDLVHTMAEVLAPNPSAAHKDKPATVKKSEEDELAMAAKDKQANADFLGKSIERVEEAVTRYLDALLSPSNGLNTSATVVQLHNLSMYQGATDIGPLLQLRTGETAQIHLSTIGSQFELIFDSFESLQVSHHAPPTAIQKENRVTELEIAFFRLGNLAAVIDSINNQEKLKNGKECTLVSVIIEKAICANLVNLIDSEHCQVPDDRQDTFIEAMCIALRPLQKLIGARAASTHHQTSQSTSQLWSLSLALCLQLQTITASQSKRKIATSNKPMTRSQRATSSATKDFSVSGNRPGTPQKGRDDFRKFLKAKRQVVAAKTATEIKIVTEPAKPAEEEDKKMAEPEEENKELEKEEVLEAGDDTKKPDEAMEPPEEKSQQSSSFEEPLAERLLIGKTAGPGLEKTMQAAELLLVYLAKLVTSGDSVGTEQLSQESLDQLLELVKKANEQKSKLYEGVLQLFCRSSLQYSPELKSIFEAKILAIAADQLSSSQILTSFVSKLILKLAFSEETIKNFNIMLLNYVFDKGFLKKSINGTLYQGISLNIYMLLLTCMQLKDSARWRQEICVNILLEKLRIALESEAAKKNTILTYLQQIWHLIALFMLDQAAQKLQKKAIFTFLTRKEPHLTVEKLLQNPFNWKVNQMQASLSVVLTTEQLSTFIGDVYRIRNVFQSNAVEEPLEIPCQIIGAQMTQIGAQNVINLANGQIELASLVSNVMQFHAIIADTAQVSKEDLEDQMRQTQQLMSAKLTDALKKLLDSPTDAELELLTLCLSCDTNKPIIDLCAISDTEFAKVLKIVLQKDCPSFPNPTSVFAKSSDKDGEEQEQKATISGLHIYQHLFSQIKPLSQTGLADIPLKDLEMLQVYHSLQTLQFAQQNVMASKFQVSESIDQIKFKTIERYLNIIEKSIAHLQAQSDQASNAGVTKSFNVIRDILGKIVTSDHFTLHQLSQYVNKLFEKDSSNIQSKLDSPLPDGQMTETAQKISQILATGLKKELILPSDQWSNTGPAARPSTSFQLQFMFDPSPTAKGKPPNLISTTTETNNNNAKPGEPSLQSTSKPIATELQQMENPILRRILATLNQSIKQQVGQKSKSVALVWQALNSLSDELATYLGEALEHSVLAGDFSNFLTSCFLESSECDQVSEHIYDAIETTCGIRTSIQGFISSQFMINCMSLANVAKNLSVDQKVDRSDDNKAEARFIQFIKEVLMQQIFESEDARLLVLDTLCMLCQDLSSQLDDKNEADQKVKKKNSYEAMVVYCRQQYLEFKEGIDARRKKDEQEAEEELQRLESERLSDAYSNSQKGGADGGNQGSSAKVDKKRKQALLEGYKQSVFDNSQTDYAKYMQRPEEECTFLRTGKKYEDQHWYYCYTCGLTGNTGVCAVCVRVCHQGHHVIYCRKSTFFCDCALDGGACSYQEQIEQKNSSNREGPPGGGLFGQPPGGGGGLFGSHPRGPGGDFGGLNANAANPFLFDSMNNNESRPPDFLANHLLSRDGGDSPHPNGLFGSIGGGGPPSRHAQSKRKPQISVADPGQERPSSRLSRLQAEASQHHLMSRQPPGGGPAFEPYMPSFAAFGQSSQAMPRPPFPGGDSRKNLRGAAREGSNSRAGGGSSVNAPYGGILGHSSLSSILGQQQSRAGQSKPKDGLDELRQHAASVADPSLRPSFANIMRRFDRIVNDESENSNNIDGENAVGEGIEHVRENELSRIIERSLSRGGALFSDANFLSSSLRLNAAVGLEKQAYADAHASDSGIDVDEDLNESNLAAIQQEMVDAGYSASEIRQSLQRRLDKQGSNKLLIEQASDSNSNSSQSEILIRSRDPGQLSNNAPEFEMSEVSSLSNASWGGVSNAESLHSAHFRLKVPLTSLQKQSQRFQGLKTILADQQEAVEGVLAQVYEHLDNFDCFEAGPVGEDQQHLMDVDTGAPNKLLMKKQSSSTHAGQEILAHASKPRNVDFKSEFVQQKHQHKEGSFKCAIQDRSTRNYVNENMQRRRCVTATDKGLICMLEDETVTFYASNSLLDSHILQGSTEKSQLYKGQVAQQQSKRGGNSSSTTIMPVVDSFKPQFVPVSAKFNPSFEAYCAVWGMNDLHVLTVCPREGKVKSDLTVNLMLAAFGEQLTILNVHWVPASRTILAVGTQIFVRIYDLAKDNFSPLFNVQLTQGSISDFTFSKPVFTEPAGGIIKTRIIVASKSENNCKNQSKSCQSGELYSHELTLVANEEQRDGSMQVDQNNNNEVFLTNQIAVAPPSKEDSGSGESSSSSTCKSCLGTIQAISYLSSYQMLVISLKTGQCIIGKLTNSFELGNCVTIPALGSVKKELAQNGDSFLYDFIEVPHMMAENNPYQCLFLLATFGKQAHQLPCLIQVSKDKIQVDIVKSKNAPSNGSKPPTVHGYSLVKPSFRKTWRKSARLLTIDETGCATVYKIDVRQSEQEERKAFNLMHELNSQRKIAKVDLPKKVTMPANFFEKQSNIWNNQSLYKQMTTSGSFASLLKSKIHRLFDVKHDQSGFADERETETKLNLNLNTRKSDHIIIGIRMKIAGSQRQGQVKFRVFEREVVTVTQGADFWYDIGFSDVEVIYGSQNQVELTFSTTSIKSCPVKLYKIEVFTASVADFQLAEKMSRHLKELHKQLEAKKQSRMIPNSSQAIKSELMQTNHLPYINWQEKYRPDAANVATSKTALFETRLSILQQFLLSNTPVKKDESVSEELRQTLVKLQSKLTAAYKSIIEQAMINGTLSQLKSSKSADKTSKTTSGSWQRSDDTEACLHASIKRTLKIVLNMLKRDSSLGDPVNFKTVKDRIIFSVIQDAYKATTTSATTRARDNHETSNDKINTSTVTAEEPLSTVTIEQIRGHLHALGAIREKRSQQYFKLIEQQHQDAGASENLVHSITEAYLTATNIEVKQQSRSEIQVETNDLVNLILADYQLHINRKQQIKDRLKSSDLKVVIGEIFEDTSLADRLEPLARLLMTKNDRVAKLVFKSVQRCLLQYQTMMARSFKSDQIVQFSYFDERSNELKENQVILVDVIPHLLHHLLLTTIPKHRERAQLPYKVSLGILNAYVMHSVTLGLPITFVFPSIKAFLRTVLCETQVTESAFQFVYASLTLLNTLLISVKQEDYLTSYPSGRHEQATQLVVQPPISDQEHEQVLLGTKHTIQIAEKAKNAGDDKLHQISPFRAHQRQKLMAFLTEGEEGKELTDRLLTWLSSALEQLNAAYQAGRCSLRVKLENQVKVGAVDYLGGDSTKASGVNLLRPVVSQQATWRWHPLLPDSDEIFELLDRKIPAAILVLCQIVTVDLQSDQQASFKKLLRAISQLSHTLPSSQIFSKLGQNTLIALAPEQAKTYKNQTLLKEFIADLKQICSTQLKMTTNFADDGNVDGASGQQELPNKAAGSQGSEVMLSYNMQFQFQRMLQNGTKLAFETPDDWRELVESTGSRNEIINMLIKLTDFVGDQSAFLCLTLAALTLESRSSENRNYSFSKAVMQYSSHGCDGQSLFHLMYQLSVIEDQEQKKKEEEESSKKQDQQQQEDSNQREQQTVHKIADIDVRKLVDVYLLGKSKRLIRITTALLLKSLYDSKTLDIGDIMPIFMGKFSTLITTGVNSSEFLSLFGYFCQKELAKGESSGIAQEQVVQIVTYIASQIKTCNMQLTSHPNLDLYATIQKVCSQGGGSSGSSSSQLYYSSYQSHKLAQQQQQQQLHANQMGLSSKMGNQFMHPPSFVSQAPGHGYSPRDFRQPESLEQQFSMAKPSGSSSQQQQYILELDPCSKCFQTMSPPYRSAGLKDLQSDQKFTDSTSIYRLKNAYQLKSINFNVHEAKGYKTVTKITLYVNSIQDVDLAEMKNNWALWQKVCDLNIDVTQKASFSMTLPLPVTATNVLIEYHSTNLTKPVEFNSRAKSSNKYYGGNPYGPGKSNMPGAGANEIKEVAGLDSVLSLLPSDISSKLTLDGVNAQSDQQASEGAAIQHSISMTCPRCGSHVNNSHGNCNNCGENAMQCPACRNINYEKIDPYQCKECGISRYCKGELTLNLREGVAIQAIESEDMKKQAEEQVESNLQKAQQSYQALMKHRQQLQQIACQINKGSDMASPKHLQTLFAGECLSQYSTMMKALSVIKQLRIEISKYQKTAQSTNSAGKGSDQEIKLDGRQESSSANAQPADLDTEKAGQQQGCFGCIHEYLQALLNFIVLTAQRSTKMREQFSQREQARQLYFESLRMFSSSIQRPARLAICALLKNDKTQSDQLLSQIENDLHTRSEQVPSHLLLQNLHQEAQLLIDLFAINRKTLLKDDQSSKTAISTFWRVLFQSLHDAKSSSAIAESVTAPILLKIEHVIHTELRESQRRQIEQMKQQQQQMKEQEEEVEQSAAMQVDDQKDDNQRLLQSKLVKIQTEVVATANQEIRGDSAMLQLLMDYLVAKDPATFEFVSGETNTCSKDGQWLVQSLLLASSQSARTQSLAIFKRLLNTEKKELRDAITELLLQYLDLSLENSPLASEEYFNLLTQLLTSEDTTAIKPQEMPKELKLGITNNKMTTAKQPEPHKKVQIQTKPAKEVSEDSKRHFRSVFSRIDAELLKLFHLEQEKMALGLDGFMPQLSAGQSLCRLVKIVALMMNDQPALTEIVQEQVRVVLKTLLKLKKLNLVKNKQIKNCEEQINRIFEKLHSENDSDKSNFIKECLSLIQSGDCDLQEARYLFEDICKMIVPAKPELEYFLHLQKARSNEEFIPGKMSKNPYSSKQFGGKTMGDVRLKICRDCDIGEPEMLELLVAGKIVTMNLPINAVYEQVWWPAQYKQKHPDSYEVPPIEQALRDDPSLINSMVVIFRLAGMDGEATEDRVESLQTDQEPSSEKELEKKYGLASVIGDKLAQDAAPSGVSVLLSTLAAIGHVQDDKDLASWLVQLMNISIKLRKNRLEFLRHPKAVAIIAKKLFQSVGMHSKFDGKNEQSLFDLILNILEVLINEQINASTASTQEATNQASHQQQQQQDQKMQVDAGSQATEKVPEDSSEAVTHVNIFLSLISDACKEMIDEMRPLDQASKKIKAVSKVLPQLIGSNDREALSTLIQLIQEHLTIEKIHLTLPSSQNASISAETFTSKFYIERIIDIIESIPVHKNFIKDSIADDMPQFNDLLQFMITQSAQFREPEVDRPEDINQNTLMLRIVKATVKNHPKSQQMLARCTLVEKLYTLSQQKFKPMKLVLLAEDCIKLLTNEMAHPEVRTFLHQTIEKKKKEQLQRAKKAKMAAKMRMQKKGAANKFLAKMQNMEEEKGPKCVTCEDGYTAKPGEILGVYVFSKKLPFREWTSSSSSSGSQSQGYTTVTHSNFIHFQCHLEAARIEREKQPPIREWDGAKTRNHMTLCNNLFPVLGGSIQAQSYESVVDKYFAMQSKQCGAADSNRVRVLCHDLKSLLKRFACNISFSRDSQGGGPEHNMQFVPFLASLITFSLSNGQSAQQNQISATAATNNANNAGAASGSENNFTYVQERKLAEFLELSTRQRQAFLERSMAEEDQQLEEEEKHSDESEEEDKRMEDDEQEEDESQMMSQSDDYSNQQQRMAAAGGNSSMFAGADSLMGKSKNGLVEDDARLDQVYFFMSQALIFGRITNWEKVKLNLLTCALCVVAATRGLGSGGGSAQGQTQARLRMMEQSDASVEEGGRARARSLSSASALDSLPEELGRLRPFLIMLALVDLIKVTWDGRASDDASQTIQEHHDQLSREYLTKGNLMDVVEDSNIFYKAYNERFTKLESVEAYLVALNLKEKIVAEFVTIEKFIVSHF